MKEKIQYVGYSCAYTPVQLITAAGFTPYKILPVGDMPEGAGEILHENICPNVKRILDRAIHNQLPRLDGVIFMNSCDAMRRLSDAWRKVRPDDRVHLIDLPVSNDERSISYFKEELSLVCEVLSSWSGEKITDIMILESINKYNTLSDKINLLQDRQSNSRLKGGSPKMQEIYNEVSIIQLSDSIELVEKVLNENDDPNQGDSEIPVYLYGNVLADTETFQLFESCGARIVADDLCTGSRMFQNITISEHKDLLQQLSSETLNRTPCARTLFRSNPEILIDTLLENYHKHNAKGVIFNTVKFCDPYLSRIPYIRKKLQEKNIPFLGLEGDCTLRSIGQQRTRIEAFIEMLR